MDRGGLINISLKNPFKDNLFPIQERREQYFIWAKKVVDNLRGTNANLELKLDEIFRQRGLL